MLNLRLLKSNLSSTALTFCGVTHLHVLVPPCVACSRRCPKKLRRLHCCGSSERIPTTPTLSAASPPKLGPPRPELFAPLPQHRHRPTTCQGGALPPLPRPLIRRARLWILATGTAGLLPLPLREMQSGVARRRGGGVHVQSAGPAPPLRGFPSLSAAPSLHLLSPPPMWLESPLAAGREAGEGWRQRQMPGWGCASMDGPPMQQQLLESPLQMVKHLGCRWPFRRR